MARLNYHWVRCSLCRYRGPVRRFQAHRTVDSVQYFTCLNFGRCLDRQDALAAELVKWAVRMWTERGIFVPITRSGYIPPIEFPDMSNVVDRTEIELG